MTDVLLCGMLEGTSTWSQS